MSIPALVPLFGLALLLGAVFVWRDVGFTGGFRAWLAAGDGRVLGATFLIPAVAALVVVPVGALGGAHGRFVAPIGFPLIVGAALFGLGMQIANGCGSGTLIAAGQGSRRMWICLPLFCLGGVLGSLAQPMADRLPDLGPVDLPALLGIGPGLLATEALLLGAAALVLRGARPTHHQLASAALLGGLCAAWFLLAGEPWGITMGLTVWGAKALATVGLDVSGFPFWAEGWAGRQLAVSVLATASSLSDLGLLLGAAAAAAVLGRMRWGAPIGWRGAMGAALGGLAMGTGARLSYGCNVGAFIGGASSGSLHGLIWVGAVLPGCWLGVRLRPVFGLSE